MNEERKKGEKKIKKSEEDGKTQWDGKEDPMKKELGERKENWSETQEERKGKEGDRENGKEANGKEEGNRKEEKEGKEINGEEDEEETCVISVEDNTEERIYFPYEDDEPIPNREEMTRRLKRVAKIIDILEFVDSCLIVGERLLKDDDEAKEIIHKIRDNILNAETLFTDYLITGTFPKIQ